MTTTPSHHASPGSDRPLGGVLVADFSRVLAGPLTTMWLADLGATVVKVERAGTGDDTRRWGPPWAGDTSSYFTAANRSKLCVEFDFNDDADLTLARELAQRADVVVENFRTGSLARFGLDYPTVAEMNPEVVYASISGYGDAHGAGLPGYDFIVQAVGGLMSITGHGPDDPMKVGVALVDVLTAKDATIGILAALQSRAQGGGGQHVKVNLLSSLLGSLANQASSFLATGQSPPPMGNQHPSIAPYETLRCRDGMIAVACGNDAQFQRLTKVLGIPEMGFDPRFDTNANRVSNRGELITVLEQQLTTHDAHHWETQLVSANVPAGQVGSIQAGFERADQLGLNPITELPQPHPPQVSHPITYSTSTPRPPTPPPALGQHNHAIKTWLTSAGTPQDLEEALNQTPQG